MRRVLGPKSIVKELEILKQVSDDARQHNIEKRHYSTSATIFESVEKELLCSLLTNEFS